jgi:hypothetical protein
MAFVSWAKLNEGNKIRSVNANKRQILLSLNEFFIWFTTVYLD